MLSECFDNRGAHCVIVRKMEGPKIILRRTSILPSEFLWGLMRRVTKLCFQVM